MSDFDRRVFLTALGGAAVVAGMSHEARADALESALSVSLLGATVMGAVTGGAETANLTAAEIAAQIPTRSYRRGVGGLLVNTTAGGTVERLQPMPPAPTLFDFFALRFAKTRNHCLQSANKAMQRGADEEVILACLIHDTVQEMIRCDHGYWGAQLFEPYVPKRTVFAVRYHQALRFYPDSAAGYEYPELYRRVFGVDYVPAPHVAAAYAYARKHRWYGAAREVTVSDLYAFDPKAVVNIEQFRDIVGRHFKQPREGLGNDGSPVAHMWRTLVDPDVPL